MENSQWFEMSPNWIRANDTRLQHNGRIQYVTTKYHNQFGTNLSKVQGATSHSYKAWKGKTNFDCPKVSMKQSRYSWANPTPFYMLEWTIGWRSLRSYYWKTPCSRCIIMPWRRRTLSGRNGGKPFKSSQRNKFKKTWN